jgi:hypothetical protein
MISRVLMVLAVLCVPATAADKSRSNVSTEAVDTIRQLRKIVSPAGIERLETVRIGGINQFISTDHTRPGRKPLTATRT